MQVLVYRTSKFKLLKINKTLNTIFLENWTVKKKGEKYCAVVLQLFLKCIYLFILSEMLQASVYMQSCRDKNETKHPSTVWNTPFWFSSLTETLWNGLQFPADLDLVLQKPMSNAILERLTEDIILLLMAKRKRGISSFFTPKRQVRNNEDNVNSV